MLQNELITTLVITGDITVTRLSCKLESADSTATVLDIHSIKG